MLVGMLWPVNPYDGIAGAKRYANGLWPCGSTGISIWNETWMPRRDKCDICRLRKVKCDAARPSCQPCLKGGRPCSYTPLNTSVGGYAAKLSGLELTSTRRASSGEGAFHTLTLRKPNPPTRALTIAHPPIPSQPLTSNAANLAARWIHMLAFDVQEESPLSGFTEILHTVPAWIGHDTVLDAAAKYTVDSHQAFMTQGESDLSVAKKSGVEALRALRFALAKCETGATDEMLLSMYIMTMSEYMSGIENYNHRFHILALCQILKARWSVNQWALLEQRLLRSIHLGEVLSSVVSGTVSDLDDPLREPVTAGITIHDDEMNQVYDGVMDHTIKLPRLSKLLREALDKRTSASISQAVKLATKLYIFSHAAQTESFLAAHTSTTLNHDAESPIQPLDFTSPKIYILANRHHMNRIILLLILRKLLNVLPGLDTVFGPAIIQSDLLSSALSITRSIPYALRPSTGPSWNAMRIFAPLTVAYGAWAELEERGDVGLDVDATALKEYCVRAFQEMAGSWRWSVGLEFLLQYSEAWTGGETMPWLGRKGKVQGLEG